LHAEDFFNAEIHAINHTFPHIPPYGLLEKHWMWLSGCTYFTNTEEIWQQSWKKCLLIYSFDRPFPMLERMFVYVNLTGLSQNVPVRLYIATWVLCLTTLQCIIIKSMYLCEGNYECAGSNQPIPLSPAIPLLPFLFHQLGAHEVCVWLHGPKIASCSPCASVGLLSVRMCSPTFHTGMCNNYVMYTAAMWLHFDSC